MRPDSTPTDPRLFPLELNATADLDSLALDDIQLILEELDASVGPINYRAEIDRIRARLRSTGRTV